MAQAKFEYDNLVHQGLFGKDEKFKTISKFIAHFWAEARKESVEADEQIEQVEKMLLSIQRQLKQSDKEREEKKEKNEIYQNEQKIKLEQN